MKTFIDNTSLHRIYKVVSTNDATLPIRKIDAVALLHLAEHILFSESILVSTFEIDHIQETTTETINLLKSHEAIGNNENDLGIIQTNFTDTQYREACNNAIDHIQADLLTLKPETISRWCKLVDEASKPIGIRGSQLEKWIMNDWGKSQRVDIASSALERKASGSFDYILGSSDAVYGQLKVLTTNFRETNLVYKLAPFLDVFFRVNINRELGKYLNSTYSPAVQRSLTINKSDELFRREVEKQIEAHIDEQSSGFASSFIQNILKHEILPLPMFAIHFLRKEKIKSPIDMLHTAYKMRHENDDVSAVRIWLNKWEENYSSSDSSKKEKAISELKNIANDLKLARERFDVSSVFRGEYSQNEDGTISIKPDFTGLSEELSKLLIKFNRPKIFLSALRREFEIEEELGGVICGMLKRPIS